MQANSEALPVPVESNDSLIGGFDSTGAVVLPSSNEPPLCRITPKEWFAVARWSWDTPFENCGICKNALVDACVDCQTRGVLTTLPFSSHSHPLPSSSSTFLAGAHCRIAWGDCRHVFHEHCLNRWLVQRAVCPLCGEEWRLQELTTND